MARYQNGTIRPSQAESVSDQIRGVRTGYLMAGGVPVTGNYTDAIRDGLRGGFGPPPTPSVGFAATAEYVYPSQKMVTGASLAGAQLRAALSQPSYSSPAADYHRGLRSLRGLGATDPDFVGPPEPEDADTGAGSDSGAAVSQLAIQLSSEFDLQAEIAQAIVDGAKGDADKARNAAAKLSAGFSGDLAAYLKAGPGAQYQYRACLRSEASDFGLLGFGGFQPEKCSALLGGASGAASAGTSFDWGALGNELVKLATGAVAKYTQPAQTNPIDAALNRLRLSGQQVPAACTTPNEHTPACAQALYALQTGGASSSNTALYLGLGAVAIVGLALFMSKRPAKQ